MLALCLAMLLGMFPAIRLTKIHAATASQNNIVARADYMYNILWTCQQDVYGWNYNTLFQAGSRYRIPYGQPINSGAYIGYYVSIDDFLTAANTAGSVYYTSRSTYSSTSSVYYATDCSAFVSWCWGTDRKTTYSIPQVSTYIGMATSGNTSLLQLGDCLNSNDVGHVVLVTDLVYNSSGALTSIEITEQTPPQLKRSYYTPSELGSKYGTYYGIYRYSGTVPAAPDGSTNSGSSSSGSTSGQYYPACSSSATTFYGGMSEIGITCDWELHQRIAAANGITDFSGTAEQNEQLLSMLKAGTLVNPDYTGSSSGDSSSGSTSTSSKYYPACSSSATTFYGGMSEIGITCDWELHQRIAAANGITDFSGTAEQNEQLLALLKAGTLVNPDYTGSSSGDSSGGTVTSGSNGYERGYAGGMAGSGEYKAFGLDVSSWQGSSLSFTRIKNAGYDYVILRAGTTNGKDTCFETYYTNAKAAGLDVGAYYYSYATSVSAVQADMEDFLSYIEGKTFEYPIYFDYEDSTQQALSSSLSQQICLTAMDMLAAEGYLVGMYTGKYFSTQLPISTICAKYELWIAHYLAVGDGSYDGTYDYTTYGPTYASQYGMYQFTDSVWINGYGPYDGDVSYKDYPSIVKKYGFNGYEAEVSDDSYLSQCTYYPSHAKLKVTEDTVIDSEPRSSSDDLESIAAGTEIVATGLYANTSTNMWYQVKTSDGKTGYLYSQRTEYLGIDTSDITITGHDLPVDHAVGDVFIVNGTIASTCNKLDKASVYIYSGQNISGDPVTGGSAAVSNNKYSLSGSTIDDATSFGDLTTGVYTYAISADYTSYYASAKKEATAVTGSVTLVDHVFSVGGAEIVESYFDKCTFYPSRVLFTTNRDTSIFSEPRTQKTGNTSVALEDAPNGTQYTSTGLYVNSGNNIFYQVTTSDGQNGYIYSGYTTFNKKAYDDIKISGATYPNGHVKGNVFEVSGTVKATYNVLGTLKVQVFTGTDITADPVTGGSGTVSNNNYALAGSAIDHAVAFDQLPTGLHTYLITVTFSSYYAKSAQELGLAEGTRTVKKHYFTVISSSTDQDSCSHKNSEAIVEEATCTDTGTKVVYCTTCGLTEKQTIAAGNHNYGSATVTKQPTCTDTGTQELTCVDCGVVTTETIAAKGHSWQAATCTTAKTCTTCGTTSGSPTSHSYSSKVTKPTCTSDGYTTYTCSSCGSSYKDNYVTATGHSWNSATCDSPMTCSTCGTTSGSALGHSWSNATCTTPKTCTTCGTTSGNALGHSWNSASCTDPRTCSVCGTTTGSANGHDYASVVTAPGCMTDGYTTHTCTTCGHSYKDSYVNATGHSWNAATCTTPMTCKNCGTVSGSSLGHSYKSTVTAPTCVSDGYTTHTCTTCGDSYKDSYVSSSGHSWNEATCTAPMTCTVCGTTTGTTADHSYVNGSCTTCGNADPNYITNPNLTVDHPSLSFESEILYNFYFTAGDLSDVVEMGLITFSTKQTDGTVATAEQVYPGYTSVGGGMYMVQTAGISAKNLGDAMYIKIYAKLIDGSYVYTSMVGYNAVVYAKSILKNSTNAYMKQLVVAMMNYGTEAQLYFGHNADNPMNSFLTADQKALVQDYSSSMLNGVTSVDASKSANVQYDGSSFAKRSPSVSFDGALSINYYFTTANKPDGDVKMYYWTMEDYSNATTLSPRNATGSMIMTNVTGNQYWGQVSGIAAKELDETIFVLGVYAYNGTTYTTGVLNYHIGKYCSTLAAKDTSTQQDLAKATAVYGYYAKEYFANI